MSRIVRPVGAVVAAVVLVASSIPATRSGLALQLEANEAALACVDQTSLERAVAATSPHPVLAPANRAAALLHIRVASSTVVLTRYLDKATGQIHEAERGLPPGSCTQKLEAIAYMVWGVSSDLELAESVRAPLLPSRGDDIVGSRLAVRHLELGAALRLDVGPLPSPATGGEVILAGRGPGALELIASAGVSVLRGHPVSVRTSADFLLADFGVAVCSPELGLAWLELRGCGGFRAGLAMADGRNFTLSSSSVSGRAEPELGITARVELGSRLRVLGRAGLLVPLVRRQYEYKANGIPSILFQEPPLELALTIGLSINLTTWTTPIGK